MRIKKSLFVVVAVALVSMGLLAGRSMVKLGNPDSPSVPANTYSYTLEDIYNRLNDGTEGDTSTFTEPTAGPGTPTMHTLNEIMGIAPVKDDANGADTSDVLTGKTFWGLNTASGQWGPQTGTMPIQTVENTTVNQGAGYYNAFNLSTVDTDLASGNIRSTVSIYGVSGNPNVVNTSSGNATAGDILSGKKAWVDGSEVAGERHGGCTCTGTLVGTRWCDNGNGTVTDLTTCLVWLKDASWGGRYTFYVDTVTGTNAHDRAAQLKHGVGGLSDGSVEGDWRLPTKTELYDLTHGTEPVLRGLPQAFTGVQDYYYWSSTTDAANTDYAWRQHMSGVVGTSNKYMDFYVWPVRGP